MGNLKMIQNHHSLMNEEGTENIELLSLKKKLRLNHNKPTKKVYKFFSSMMIKAEMLIFLPLPP